jgi:hypothetical protein
MDWITNELLQFIPVVGQAIAGLISASVSGAVGGFWWWACEKAYKEQKTPALVIRETLA